MEVYGYKPQSSQSLTSYQSTPWRQKSVIVFTSTLTYKSVCKTYLLAQNNDKGKDAVELFVDVLCNLFDLPGAVHDIIWSDGLSSESKNKFMT